MAYMEPSLELLGAAASIILGSSPPGEADNGADNGQPNYKAEDIVAGLDE